jgi:hypothetical protein
MPMQRVCRTDPRARTERSPRLLMPVAQRAEGLIVVKKKPKTAPVRLNLNTGRRVVSKHARAMARGGPRHVGR